MPESLNPKSAYSFVILAARGKGPEAIVSIDDAYHHIPESLLRQSKVKLLEHCCSGAVKAYPDLRVGDAFLVDDYTRPTYLLGQRNISGSVWKLGSVLRQGDFVEMSRTLSQPFAYSKSDVKDTIASKIHSGGLEFTCLAIAQSTNYQKLNECGEYKISCRVKGLVPLKNDPLRYLVKLESVPGFELNGDEIFSIGMDIDTLSTCPTFYSRFENKRTTATIENLHLEYPHLKNYDTFLTAAMEANGLETVVPYFYLIERQEGKTQFTVIGSDLTKTQFKERLQNVRELIHEHKGRQYPILLCHDWMVQSKLKEAGFEVIKT